MNKIYESETMVVHDDTELISFDQAYNTLIDNRTIKVCDLPNYSAEEESEIFSHPFEISIDDIIVPETRATMQENDIKAKVYDYLRGYDLSL